MNGEDADRIRLLAQGDHEVMADILDTYVGVVKQYTQRRLWNDVESDELTHQAFSQLYILIHEKPELISRYESFEHLFFALVKGMVNEALRERQTARKHEAVLKHIPRVRLLQPEQVALGNEVMETVRQGVADLPETCRAEADLFFLQQYSYEETAIITDKPLNTVKTRIRRARYLLARMLCKYFKGGWK
jgi:RNA polymerase sigma factor (sigma-70 family)